MVRALLLIPAQIAGGIVAAELINVLLPGALDVANTLGPGVSVIQGLFIEVFLTAMLVVTILMLAVEKHRATPLAPLAIGGVLTLVHLIGINYTGTSVNPARSFGPNVITGKFTTYHWIYWYVNVKVLLIPGRLPFPRFGDLIWIIKLTQPGLALYWELFSLLDFTE